MYTAIVARSLMAERARLGLVTPIAATSGPSSGNSDTESNRTATDSFPPETSLAQDMTQEWVFLGHNPIFISYITIYITIYNTLYNNNL